LILVVEKGFLGIKNPMIIKQLRFAGQPSGDFFQGEDKAMLRFFALGQKGALTSSENSGHSQNASFFSPGSLRLSNHWHLGRIFLEQQNGRRRCSQH